MATATLTASGNWSDAIWSGGNGPGGAPADGDSVITGEYSVLMNADLSAWTGLLDVTVSSGAVTPGMIYFKDGTSGYLKIRTGYSLKGTSGTVLGRVLANSDGVWGNVGSLAYTNKAVIDLQGTAKIDPTYLDLAFYDTRPDHTFVETYGLAYTCTDQTTDVNVGTDVITFTSAPPAAGTAVIVRSSGALPGGLLTTDVYYVRTVSGNTCKLALQSSDATIVDITSTGSGTLTMYTGHTNLSTATMNIIQDISADPQWTTTSGHNRIVLVDSNAPEDYDQQRVTIAGKTASTITLSENVNSAQYPGAKIFLLSSNVSLRSTGASTSQAIVDFSSSSSRSGVFQCEIANTLGTGTTFYGIGIYYGTGHTISGTISGCNYGVNYVWDNTISGIIAGCSQGIRYGYRNTISGTVSGCSLGVIYGSGNTVSGAIGGCSAGVSYGSCNTISGIVSGCNNGFSYSSGNILSGTVNGCFSGFTICASTLVSGKISGCNFGTQYGSCRLTSGTISGCTNGSYYTDFTGLGMVLSGNATDVAYSGVYTAPLTKGISFTHAGTANDTRAWSAGGAMTHETTIVPTGKSYSHKFTHVDDDYWTLMQWEISRVEALTVSITVHAKHDITSLAADARIHWQLIDPNGNDPLVDAGAVLLDEFIAVDSTDWQSDTLSTTRTDDRPLIVRACAKRGSGNSYIYLEPIVAGAGGGLPVLGGSIVR